MVIREIFPNPTVKQVIFQIRFPILFYIEAKVGDLQMRFMDKFPTSALIFQRQMMFAEIGPEQKIEDVTSKFDQEYGRKIWQFKSNENFQLNILQNSLDITSSYHKTYDLGSDNNFRDIIEYVLKNFIEIIPIPVINRIGLRYVDECPLPTKDNETLKSYYNSVFPTERFNFADTDEMLFRTTTKKGDYYITYMETLQKIGNEYKLILDFDGFANKIQSKDCLKITDELHSIISEEFVNSIKQPVYEYMRRGRDANE